MTLNVKEIVNIWKDYYCNIGSQHYESQTVVDNQHNLKKSPITNRGEYLYRNKTRGDIFTEYIRKDDTTHSGMPLRGFLWQ
jgi:hypothetical protein